MSKPKLSVLAFSDTKEIAVSQATFLRELTDQDSSEGDKKNTSGRTFSKEEAGVSLNITSLPQVDFLNGGHVARRRDFHMVFFDADFNQYASPANGLINKMGELENWKAVGKDVPIFLIGISEGSQQEAKELPIDQLQSLYRRLCSDTSAIFYLSAVNLEEKIFLDFKQNGHNQVKLSDFWKTILQKVPSLKEAEEVVQSDGEKNVQAGGSRGDDEVEQEKKQSGDPSTPLLTEDKTQTSSSFFSQLRPRPLSSQSMQRRLAVRLAMSVLVTGGLFPLPLMACAYASYELEKKVDNRLFRKKEFRG